MELISLKFESKHGGKTAFPLAFAGLDRGATAAAAAAASSPQWMTESQKLLLIPN